MRNVVAFSYGLKLLSTLEPTQNVDHVQPDLRHAVAALHDKKGGQARLSQACAHAQVIVAGQREKGDH